jgi:hypothetical protein
MSDVSRGPGWWIASDGRWYPPEQHPGYRPPPPPAPLTAPVAPPTAPVIQTMSVVPQPWAAPAAIDVPPGPGWWKAADGQWYPPERHPNRQTMVPSVPLQGAARLIPTTAVQGGAPARVVGKTRNPWAVWLLGLTIVYSFVWYFKINRELRDFDHSIDVQPGLSVVAVTFGVVLIGIPPIVSWVHTTRRIQKAQKLAGTRLRCSMLMSFLSFVFGSVYLQSHLNKVWDQFGNPPERTPIAA